MCYNETMPFPLNTPPLPSALFFIVGGEGSYMNIYDLLYATELGVRKQAIGTHF